MRCESNCQPHAYNRSGAAGLMQVLRRWFNADQDPFDPTTNLSVALRVWHVQGWHAWSCY
jgi:soluble lytic murein transglycosylase-like protein